MQKMDNSRKQEMLQCQVALPKLSRDGPKGSSMQHQSLVVLVVLAFGKDTGPKLRIAPSAGSPLSKSY